MTIVTNTFAYVIGADIHSRTNTLTALDTGTGARLDTQMFPTTQAGLSRALAWMRQRTKGVATRSFTIWLRSAKAGLA